jgi:hypothetical protein
VGCINGKRWGCSIKLTDDDGVFYSSDLSTASEMSHGAVTEEWVNLMLVIDGGVKAYVDNNLIS